MQDGRVCILGMGYVGLTLAVVMAERGFEVLGLEVNPTILEKLQKGKAHFFEAGLDLRLPRVLASGKLRFARTFEEAKVATAPSVFLVTVGTPLGSTGAPRMDMVESVAREVARCMPDGALVVLRSTVKLGTTRKVVLPILQASGRKFHLAYCPERTVEGKALAELTYLPQIVGGLGSEDAFRAAHVFQHVTPTIVRVSTLEGAEIIKLLDNSYRDLFFGFGNEVALLCDAAGLDGIEVIRAANMGYERTNLAAPGFVGGPCLQKDPHILVHSLAETGFEPKLIASARALNEALPDHVLRMIRAELPKQALPAKPAIAVCGVAFKGRPETDDTRGTPVNELVATLRREFPVADLRGHDFKVPADGIAALGLRPCSLDEAFDGASLVIIANNNARYELVDVDTLAVKMARPAMIFDAWSILPLQGATVPDGVLLRRLGSAAAWRNGR